MVKKSSSVVLASLRGSPYGTEYDSPLRSLRPCLWSGASWRTGAGRVRTLAFLNILPTTQYFFNTVRLVRAKRTGHHDRIFHPVKDFLVGGADGSQDARQLGLPI